MRLYDLATVMRSKNAGPYLITIDMLFQHSSHVDRVLASANFTSCVIAQLYDLEEHDVQIHAYRPASAIKVTLPRGHTSAGSALDRDIYGAQQYFPLAAQDV